MSEQSDRRNFLGGVAMTGGLVAGYGTFFSFAGRFLYPAKGEPTGWMFVAPVADFKPGEARAFLAPNGARVVIRMQGGPGDGGSGGFTALSSTCPHLGCQVHWEGHNNRFFCPCHNGVFDPLGKGLEGPPKGMSLKRYALRMQGPVLFIEVPVDRLPSAEDALGARRGVPPLQLAGLHWRNPSEGVRA